MARCVGLDVHREFAQVAIWDRGRVTDAGRWLTSPEGLRAFAKTLRPRIGSLEATMKRPRSQGCWVNLSRRSSCPIRSSPERSQKRRSRPTRSTRGSWPSLLAADYLPAVWLAYDATKALRRQVTSRVGLVLQRTRAKHPRAGQGSPRVPDSDRRRKLLVIGWHLVHDETDEAFLRPSLLAKKQRALELRAGDPARKGHKARPPTIPSRTSAPAKGPFSNKQRPAYRHSVERRHPTRPAGTRYRRAPKGSRTIVRPRRDRAVKTYPPGAVRPVLTALPTSLPGRPNQNYRLEGLTSSSVV